MNLLAYALNPRPRIQSLVKQLLELQLLDVYNEEALSRHSVEIQSPIQIDLGSDVGIRELLQLDFISFPVQIHLLPSKPGDVQRSAFETNQLQFKGPNVVQRKDLISIIAPNHIHSFLVQTNNWVNSGLGHGHLEESSPSIVGEIQNMHVRGVFFAHRDSSVEVDSIVDQEATGVRFLLRNLSSGLNFPPLKRLQIEDGHIEIGVRGGDVF